MPSNSRRRLLGTAIAIGGAATLPGAASLANPKHLTPAQSRGPFYPRTLPLDNDNDLVHVRGQAIPARGVHTNLVGQVLSAQGQPIAGARVEIWQCDAAGNYHHPEDQDRGRDLGFQGYGHTLCDADGRYRFLTIRPVAYPGRAPHIHMAVTTKRGQLVTQIYVAGAPENENDWLLGRAGGPNSSLVVPFVLGPDPDSVAEAQFDVVMA